MLKKAIVAMAVSAGMVSLASADTLFSNIGNGIGPAEPIFSGQLPNRVLEDVVFGQSDPAGFSITAVNIGFDNTGTSAATFDVLLDFYNTVDYSQSVVAGGAIASDVRLAVINAMVGADETNILALPAPITIADDSVGIAVRFVQTDTTIPATAILPLFKDIPIQIGASNAIFGHDSDNNNSFEFGERLTWEGDGFPAANMYLQVFGNVVPEPATIALLLPAALFLRRRA